MSIKKWARNRVFPTFSLVRYERVIIVYLFIFSLSPNQYQISYSFLIYSFIDSFLMLSFTFYFYYLFKPLNVSRKLGTSLAIFVRILYFLPVSVIDLRTKTRLLPNELKTSLELDNSSLKYFWKISSTVPKI